MFKKEENTVSRTMIQVLEYRISNIKALPKDRNIDFKFKL